MTDAGTPRSGRSGPVLVLGASSGFGFALAQRLHSSDTPVIGAARSSTPPGTAFDYRQVDVTDDGQMTRLVDSVVQEYGIPYGMVYCPSSTAAVGHSWQLDIEDLSALFDVTLLGFVRAVNRCLPLMAQNGEGSIVLVGSRAARVPVETLAGYASAKAAAEQFARCLAQEAEPLGVRANVIGISADTPLARRHLDLRADTLGRTEAFPDLPAVEDNLALAEFLLTPQARFVTGQTIEARQPLWT
ncbi:SDR family NAD(P)-dependent oxidoreductase [Streptomyces sp. NPDC056347]|uniref:SDR family NAD(P)-dependent oxidoreductase n=1 Tax=Streptomyces sp. NPDC056347 TaxID=3345790 RepID=UPI0035E2D5A0